MAIHGNKSQSAREKALSEFKAGRLRVLVATDIAARGIDIDGLPHVVNYELPNVPEDYVHRIGRTGRAGAGGEACSLVCVDEHKLLRDIERTIKLKIEQVVVPGFEPDPNAKPEPLRKTPPPRAPRADKPTRAQNAPAAVRPARAQPKPASSAGNAPGGDGGQPARRRRPRGGNGNGGGSQGGGGRNGGNSGRASL